MIYQLVPCTEDSSGCAVGKGSLKRACVGFILWLSGLIKGAGIQTAFFWGGGGGWQENLDRISERLQVRFLNPNCENSVIFWFCSGTNEALCLKEFRCRSCLWQENWGDLEGVVLIMICRMELGREGPGLFSEKRICYLDIYGMLSIRKVFSEADEATHLWVCKRATFALFFINLCYE